ncbi:guanosine monophosphate reductase [Rhodospirillum rubrum]|uniref:IMP dehydrogenase n=2 Tax=Rhodospirillum rubrum TaxID=1085 RepID=UPI00190580B2|nr:IMP dehydrogenase [Rhodospirillum rubrum]MBK1666080.1 guanosine monophosphate reductase [Rhodospirillum rubrum]
MIEGLRSGLSFDDVLLVPGRTRARSRADITLASRFSRRIALALPLVSANVPWCTQAPMAIALGRLGGLGVLHRMCAIEDQERQVALVKSAPVDGEDAARATVDDGGALIAAAAVGAKPEDLERADRLVAAGCDALVVDIAHGHADYALDTIAALKSRHPQIDVIGGNVATAEGTADLIAAGADAIKVGIGPGGICTTRRVAGAGVPQMTAIADCVGVARARNVPVIADGGIRFSGDIVKALAVGAASVMLGSLLAGTDESAAVFIDHQGRRCKATTGFVTLGVGLTRKRLRGEKINAEDLDAYVAEGVESTFEASGPLARLIGQLAGGIRSGVSYGGALTIAELQDKARFIRVSEAGRAESRPHALDRAPAPPPDYARLFVEEEA